MGLQFVKLVLSPFLKGGSTIEILSQSGKIPVFNVGDYKYGLMSD
jgi:hypothetical protein